MGMFDTITVVNVSDPDYNNASKSYQTKSLACNGSHYIVFNGQLWIDHCGIKSETYKNAKPINHTGAVNIYTTCKRGDKEYWIEYDLQFIKGTFEKATVIDERITKDHSDLYTLKPLPRSTSPSITLDFHGVDGENYQNFMSDLDENVAALRKAACSPKAEVIYKKIKPSGAGVTGLSLGRWIHNIVQDKSDFEAVSQNTYSQEDRHGNQMTLLVDEFHSFSESGLQHD